MIPLSANQVVNNGIAVYCPTLTEINKYVLKIEIYYSLNRKNFFWLKCNNQQTLLWSRQTIVENNPVLFLYRRKNLLKEGFYQIKLIAFGNGQKYQGSKTIGTLKPTKSLHIGLGYSIYSPINLS